MFKHNPAFFSTAPADGSASSTLSEAEIECLDTYWDIYIKTIMERSFLSCTQTEQKNRLIHFWENLILQDEAEFLNSTPLF